MCFNTGNPQQSYHYIPSVILDDLSSRFILNLPPEDRWNLVRVCFHVELAHWFYLDNYCKIYKLRPCGQRKFAAHIFQHIPTLHIYFSNLDTVLENWRVYKRSLPSYGAILLDEDLSHVLLVQSYCAKTSWGFPKGKVNEDEEPWECAAREVLEETGFNISKLINKREFIDATINGRTIRLYIVANIPRDTNFKPLTQNEIKACVWFPLNGLPSDKKPLKPKVKMSVGHNTFFMVIPFLKEIRHWVSERNRYGPVKSTEWTHEQAMTFIKLSTNKVELGISQELLDALWKYQQKNFPTQDLQKYFTQRQDFPAQELQIAYMKYLQRNQPTQKLLNMFTKNHQQNLPYYKYHDGQLYQVQNSPMTANNSHVWNTNTNTI